MDFAWNEMFSMAFILFLLMDPIGNVPIFISILKNVSSKRQLQIILRELVIALLIIVTFHFLGEALLRFLHVSMPTLLISGGVILFLIALKMIFPSAKDGSVDDAPSIPLLHKEPFIVPLATPLVAGPAVLAAVILYAGQKQLYPGVTLSAIIVAWAASTVILMSATLWRKLLGERGLIACERLMGLVLTLIAIQMLLEGVALFLNLSK